MKKEYLIDAGLVLFGLGNLAFNLKRLNHQKRQMKNPQMREAFIKAYKKFCESTPFLKHEIAMEAAFEDFCKKDGHVNFINYIIKD